MRVGILLISTGNYGIFLQPLIASIDKYFFINDNIEIYLFSDKKHDIKKSDRINIKRIGIEHKPFPYPTLHRYKYFTQAAYIINSDFLFYLDVDMLIVGSIGGGILPNGLNTCGLVATLHPGFYKGGGSWCENPQSLAFMPKELHNKYYAGGFQGGKTGEYLAACKIMAENIEIDEKNGIIANWHDESHWNAYLSNREAKELTPEYCMVEERHLRVAWGIDSLSPKIIALKKNHDVMRNK